MPMTVAEQNTALRKALEEVISERDRFAANLARLEALVETVPEIAQKMRKSGSPAAQDEIRAGLATVGPFTGNVTDLFLGAGAERAASELKKNTKTGPADAAIRKALQGGTATLGDGTHV